MIYIENAYLIAAQSLYNKEFDNDSIIDKLNCSIPYRIEKIQEELICLFNDITTLEPCCYFNKDVFEETISNLNKLKIGVHSLSVDEEMLELFIASYNAYNQITNIINDLSCINDSHSIKNRQYRLPTYVSIVESCLTNIYRFIVLLINQTTEKDYASNYKLSPLCEILRKSGFEQICQSVDINIRNAINHGGVIFLNDGEKINFHYNENHKFISKTLTIYDFDKLIEKVYDTASAVLLGVAAFLNENWNLISYNISESTVVSLSLLSMRLSVPTIRCRYISESECFNQLNAEFIIQNTERDFLLRTGVILAILIYSKFNNYDKYYVSFCNERLMTSWVRFNNNQLSDLLNNRRELREITDEMLYNSEIVLFDASTEPIDMQEIKYFRFPNYQCDEYKINDIADASMPNRKRLRCKLYIGDIDDKETILKIISKSVEWVKQLKNVDSPTIHRKCGTMEADAVYMNVYRKDSRAGKEMFPNNENFVCFVDYNLSGETTLLYGGIPKVIWVQLFHEQIGKYQIAWRDRKYLTLHKKKISPNELCPCGSGEKFKKCCKIK